MRASLTFLGAAGTVTGAKFLLETSGGRVLIECGLFQGSRDLREGNWKAFPVPPASISAVLLSHAHVDHSGYLPRLVRQGFTGPIYCSTGTAALLAIMLPDSAQLQEEEAEWRNRKGKTRHEPALPLYTAADAAAALTLVKAVPYGRSLAPSNDASARFLPSGHILGASIVEVVTGGRRLVYSGDLGRYDVPVMRDPVAVAEADTLLVESTYGDREHPGDDGTRVIVEAVQRAVSERGLLLIPAFAVGRTQDVLYLLRELEESGRIPRVPVYLDSPMGTMATALYAQATEEHDAETRRVTARGGKPFVPSRFHLSRSVDDSKALNGLDGPAVIVAGSGMATGGRILHHLRRRIADDRTTVLFVGYQAVGTRGRMLRDGAKTLRIFGEDLPVRARIMTTGALSAHADRGEILRWLRGFRRPPVATYAVHGEPEAAAALREAIERELGWRAAVPAAGARIEI
jgi:metallo-beta-lactamase family protein